MASDYNLLSNAELRIKLSETKDEYEAIKLKINSHFERMGELEKRYSEVLSVLNDRLKVNV